MFCTLLTNTCLPNTTNLKTEREQNKPHTPQPWPSAQLCLTQCARDMEGSNDCNPLQSTSFPPGWQESPLPLLPLLPPSVFWLESIRLWLSSRQCRSVGWTLKLLVQFMQRGYLQQQDSSSQERKLFGLSTTCQWFGSKFSFETANKK